MAKPKNLQKALEIQRVVARLFAYNGYHATSMREIGRAIGMNQSSLYHYFKSKEDILFKIMNNAVDEALAILEGICSADLSPEEKLSDVLGFYTRYYAGDQERLTILVNEMHSLSKPFHRVLLKKQRRYVLLIRSILDELALEDKMNTLHPGVATFAFFGMVHYTVKWYHEKGPVKPDELANQFVEIFTKGILK